MSITDSKAPFQHSGANVSRMMQRVIYGLLPGVLASLWFFGIGIFLNFVIALSFALLAEAIMLLLRGRSVTFSLADRSVFVTAALFAIAIPPGSPWWLAALGIVFAIVIAKHLYGGLGQNPFNPAMCGYAMLLLAFPLEMTSWHIPSAMLSGSLSVDNLGIPLSATQIEVFSPLSWQGMQQSLQLAFPFTLSGSIETKEFIDGFAMATPLIEFKMAGQSALLAARESGFSFYSRQAGTGWEVINFCYLLGGLYLLSLRVISWHIPVTIILTILAMSLLFYAPGSTAIYGTPYLHLFGSATMIGAFFIATDPVSAATTRGGKLVYGIIVGLSIYAIRVWGSYLDSIAFAVLFGNFCAPLLDHFCRPRIFGHGARRVIRTPLSAENLDR